MDKKIKKKIDTFHQRIQNLRQQIAGAKKQVDDPAELKNLEKQLAATEAELSKIKGESAGRRMRAEGGKTYY